MDSNNKKIKNIDLLNTKYRLSKKILRNQDIFLNGLLKKSNKTNSSEIKEVLSLILGEIEEVKNIEYEIQHRNFEYTIFYKNEDITITKLLKILSTKKEKLDIINKALYQIKTLQNEEMPILYLEFQNQSIQLIKDIDEIQDILSDFNCNN